MSNAGDVNPFEAQGLNKSCAVPLVWGLLLAFTATLLPALRVGAAAPGPAVSVYLTTADLSSRLARQPDLHFTPATGTPGAGTSASVTPGRPASTAITPTIDIDDTRVYQQIDGFGGAMTDSSAWLLATKLAPAARDRVVFDLFDPVHGLGLSIARVPMGASDFTRDGAVYSYDDTPDGNPDPALAGFSVAHDMTEVVPMLREALHFNPGLKLMATPWVLPSWMQTGMTSPFAGTILPAAYKPLADYFVKFIQAYGAQGLPIYAVTPHNEPGQDPGYPGIIFPALAEAQFIGRYLGPALAAAGLQTRILAYDGFWDTATTGSTPDYPFLILADPVAGPYVAGTAWHCYSGGPDVMARSHALYPGKDNYVTECSSGFTHGDVSELIIASLRDWARGVLLWNLALDQFGGPPRAGQTGCPNCIAPVTVYTDTARAAYTTDYYELGQASRFIRPGAYRIASTSPVARHSDVGLGCGSGTSYGAQTIDDVAVMNSDGSKALLTYNPSGRRRPFTVRWGGQAFSYALAPCATATFVWTGKQRESGVGSRESGVGSRESGVGSRESRVNFLTTDY